MERHEKEIETIAEHYDLENQCRQCIEEMAELTKAICKDGRNRDIATILHMAEEVADVIIMVEQLRLLLGKELVDGNIDRKINVGL